MVTAASCGPWLAQEQWVRLRWDEMVVDLQRFSNQTLSPQESAVGSGLLVPPEQPV